LRIFYGDLLSSGFREGPSEDGNGNKEEINQRLHELTLI
jgi:hypothetical protein